jgi:membrane-associated phospholipid phosphatase
MTTHEDGAVGAENVEAVAEKAPLISVGLVIAFVAIVLLVVAFAALADEFPEKGGLSRLDLAITTWFQHHATDGGDRFFVIVSLIGVPGIAMVDVIVAAALAVRRRWGVLVLWVTAVGGAALLNVVLKLIFHRARPLLAAKFIHGQSWSFPSGHAMASIVGITMLVYILRGRADGRAARIAIVAGAAVLILVIGFSRIYLGVHYLSDVMAGFLGGGAWVLACITADTVVRNSIARRG